MSKWEIKILSDEEFERYKKEEKRKAFLKELEQMSKPATQVGGSNSFSIKDIKPKKETKPQLPEQPVPVDTNAVKPINVAVGTDWGDFVSDLESNSLEYSPIESITDEQMSGFQLDENLIDEDDKYGKVFKKELAMLSEVLKDVKSHGTTVRNQLNKMSSSGKGAGSRSVGITKNYSDLVVAYNGINTTKLQIIKEMAALRSKQVDWKLKATKDNIEGAGQDVDSIADTFYRNIINGGPRNITELGAQQFPVDNNFEYNPIFDDQPSSVLNREELDPSKVDGLAMNMGFNPTQPIQGVRFGNSLVNGDEFGNIANEGKDIDICVYELSDGHYQFVALDRDGEVVEGVELPSDTNPDVVDSLHIKPGSDYVYDFANRKYRVIQMGPTDISDIEDMEYPYFDDDSDKR